MLLSFFTLHIVYTVGLEIFEEGNFRGFIISCITRIFYELNFRELGELFDTSIV